MKDEDNETDFDFYYSGGQIHNWIANFNGKSLPGKGLDAVFLSGMKSNPKSTELYSAIGVVSDQDAAIYRLDDGKAQYSFDKMFFTKPAVKKPHRMLAPMNGSVLLINDKQVYQMIKGTYFANTSANSYSLSPHAALSSLDIFFDEKSKTVIPLDNNTFRQFLTNGDALKNTNSDLLWMEGYVYPRNTTSLLLKNTTTQTGRLIKLSSTYSNLISSTGQLVLMDKALERDHPLLQADHITGNFDNDIVYYTKVNKLFALNFASMQSELQITFDSQTQVTCMQHIKFPAPGSAGVVNKIDYIAVATYTNGKYKVWLYKLDSLGNLIAKSSPDFEGNGRVSHINYIENGQGTRNF